MKSDFTSAAVSTMNQCPHISSAKCLETFLVVFLCECETCLEGLGKRGRGIKPPIQRGAAVSSSDRAWKSVACGLASCDGLVGILEIFGTSVSRDCH